MLFSKVKSNSSISPTYPSTANTDSKRKLIDSLRTALEKLAKKLLNAHRYLISTAPVVSNPLDVQAQSISAFTMPNELRAKTKKLTCVTLFPDQVQTLESTQGSRKAKHPEGSISQLYRLAKMKGETRYGELCESHCIGIEHRVRTGAIASFSELWVAAQDAIHHIRSLQETGPNPAFKTRRVATSADENLCICFTPWEKNYVHIAREVLSNFLNTHRVPPLSESYSASPIQIEGFELQLVEFDHSRVELKQTLWGTPDEELCLPCIPLTQLCIHFDKNLLHLPANSLELDKAIRMDIKERPVTRLETHYVELLNRAPKITHTAAIQLDHCEQQLNHLFKQLLQQDDKSEAALKLLARIYWWSANALFDARGSAAKTELLFRALCKFKLLDLPPWKAGVAADLLCMKMSEAQWVSEFRNHLALCQ